MLVTIPHPNFKYFSILQQSNMATKCGLRQLWNVKVKPYLNCHINIATRMSYDSFFSSWYSKNWRSYGRSSKCQDHLVTPWPCPLTWDLEKPYFLDYRYSCIAQKYDYYIRIHPCDIGLRSCPRSHPLLVNTIHMNIVGNIRCDVTSLMILSWSKWFRFT